MKITIVGSGHGGCAMAAVMARLGHSVNILKLGKTMHVQNFQALRSAKKIRLCGIEGEGVFPLSHVSSDPAEVIPQAELVLVYYVANFHPMVSARLAPHLHQAQTLVLNPGYAGTLIFLKAMESVGNGSLPLFAEFETPSLERSA